MEQLLPGSAAAQHVRLRARPPAVRRGPALPRLPDRPARDVLRLHQRLGLGVCDPDPVCDLRDDRRRARAGWKLVLRLAMAAAIVPVVFSLNRGLWLSLGLASDVRDVPVRLRGDFRQAVKVVAGVHGGRRRAGREPARQPRHGPVLSTRPVTRAGCSATRRRSSRSPTRPCSASARRSARCRRPPRARSRHRERDLPARLLARHPGARALADLVLLHALPFGQMEIALGVLGAHHDPRGADPGSVLRRHRADTADAWWRPPSPTAR